MTENADLLKAVFSNGLEEVSYLGGYEPAAEGFE